MTPRRLLLTVSLCGLALTPLLTSLPASAATTNAPASAAIATTAPHVDSRVDGDTATLTITGTDSATATVRDAAERAIAGATLRDGSATVSIRIPATESSFAVTLTSDGIPSDSTPLTFHDGIGDQLSAPKVEKVDLAGADRAVMTTAGTPGATVRVKDSEGTTVGVKVVGASGTTQVPVSVDPAAVNELTTVQTIGAQQSDATETSYVAKPTRVDLAGVYDNGANLIATLAVQTPVETTGVDVVDSFGNRIGGGSAQNNPYGQTVRVPKGQGPVDVTIYAVVDGIRSEGVPFRFTGEVQRPADPRLVVVDSTATDVDLRIEAVRGLDFLVDNGGQGQGNYLDSGKTVNMYGVGNDGKAYDGNFLTIPRSAITGDKVYVTLHIPDQDVSSETIAIDVPKA